VFYPLHFQRAALSLALPDSFQGFPKGKQWLLSGNILDWVFLQPEPELSTRCIAITTLCNAGSREDTCYLGILSYLSSIKNVHEESLYLGSCGEPYAKATPPHAKGSRKLRENRVRRYPRLSRESCAESKY